MKPQFSSVQSSHSVVSDSLRPDESQHARPPCPSPNPGVHSNSRPSSRDAIQPSHPLSSPSPPAPSPSQHQSLFQWVNSSHEVAKILEFQLQHYSFQRIPRAGELPDVQAGFRKGRGTRDQIANFRWIIKKAREFQKNICFCLLTMPKPLTLWITINCGKFWKRWEYQTTYPASWEICMQVRKQQLELEMEQRTGSK